MTYRDILKEIFNDETMKRKGPDTFKFSFLKLKGYNQ